MRIHVQVLLSTCVDASLRYTCEYEIVGDKEDKRRRTPEAHFQSSPIPSLRSKAMGKCNGKKDIYQ